MVQLLFVVMSIHAIVCPFTKVEESFNMQATHDILYHRFNLWEYDHIQFPGVVPRTFIGPLIMSLLSTPSFLIIKATGLDKYWMQYIVRLALALTVIVAWSRLKSTLQKLYGKTYVWWFTCVTVTQFHFIFYMSRPLPNIMALPLVLLSFDGWLAGRPKQFLISSGAGIILFRSELAMLFGLFLIIDLYYQKIEISRLMKIVVPVGLTLITLTVIIDSVFWGRPVWPEAEVFWYNTFLNKSSNWGTSPFLWYFYSALPRGLGPSILLIPLGVYFDKRMVQVLVPALLYVLLYSFLPHKELRFIIYVFPLLNMVSAAACSHIFIRRMKSLTYLLMFWGQILIMLGNIAMTIAFILVAMTNYPGGVALFRLHKMLMFESYVHVHIGNLAAQTGVTRFIQVNDNWKYNKTEFLTLDQLQVFTHLLMEAKSKYSPNIKALANTHDVLDIVESFSHISVTYKIFPPLKIKTRPAIFILQRKDFRKNPYGISDNSDAGLKTDYSEKEVINVELRAAQPENDANSDETSAQSEEIKETVIEEVIHEKEKAYDIVENDNEDKREIEEDPTSSVKDKTIDPSIVLPEPEIQTETATTPRYGKAKKSIEDVKSLRVERKKKAIQKIKTETRKEVVASAKEKLREIMKRHKHIADELSFIEKEQQEETDGRGDIPEIQREKVTVTEYIAQVEGNAANQTDLNLEANNDTGVDMLENIIQSGEATNRSNENVDSIVEEVITRLLDRKIYDDKTKPEDIKAEDRLVIQKIVEEVLAERMNYTNSENKF